MEWLSYSVILVLGSNCKIRVLSINKRSRLKMKPLNYSGEKSSAHNFSEVMFIPRTPYCEAIEMKKYACKIRHSWRNILVEVPSPTPRQMSKCCPNMFWDKIPTDKRFDNIKPNTYWLRCGQCSYQTIWVVTKSVLFRCKFSEISPVAIEFMPFERLTFRQIRGNSWSRKKT